MAEIYRSQEGSAPFNMALATLERISDVLREYRRVGSDPNIPNEIKQPIRIELVKQLLLNAAPLLKDSVVKQYEDKILDLTPETKSVIKKNGDNYSHTNYKQTTYSIEVDKKCNQFVIQISKELQKEKYFMPPKKDLSLAVTEF